MALVNREDLIKAIKDKYNYASATAFLLTMRDILPQDVVYQTLAIIDNAPSIPDPNFMTATELENAFICGYRVKDLIVLGKLFRDKGITENELVNASESFLAGYRKAYEEINEAINKTVNSIGSKDTDPITELFGVNGEEFIVSGGVIMPKKED